MKLPQKFIESIRPLLGQEWSCFEEALSEESAVSIRTNPGKAHRITQSEEQVPWCETGYYLDRRPSFTFDPLFHTGTYYVQEASSMFVEQVFMKYVGNEKVKVLDLCAAPGGKSTHIASLISDDSLLVSNEVIRSRANILSENITKAGYSNVIVTNNDPSNVGELTSFFDIILVDAPCSGEGMFRKDPGAVDEWSPANVQLCAERQRRIVADVWDSLKPGGILIYSTCTYNRIENEDNIIWIRDNLGAEILPLEVQSEWGITPSYDKNIDAYHFFPYKTKGEGFFLSVMRKKDEIDSVYEPERKGKTKKENRTKEQALPLEYKKYIRNFEDFIFFNKSDSWFAFPKLHYDDFQKIVAELRLVSAGIYVGEVKGKDLIPQHSLAMSVNLNKDSFVLHDIDKETAIAYLRKEALSFPDLPKGYILLTYEEEPLGFIKNIGNRANNLYPNEWRIRSAHQPEKKNF
ncbi:rRNA cytosine-C5-methyltransferase [Dysgonomonas sp. OttesenSCG-928-M03]|nr:rRNA cytosine-C5-methyltransferase [Dysgonomonas sp. OttesenSCG-928-M03]